MANFLWLPLKYYSELKIPSLSEKIQTRLLYLSVDIADVSFPRLFQNVSGPSKQIIRAKNFKSVFYLTHTNEIQIKKTRSR